MAKKERFYDYKTIKVGGAYHHLFRGGTDENWVHHNPDGPAITPVDPDDKSIEKKYYIFGFEKTKDEFKDYQQSKEGLPWYKNPSMNLNSRF